MKFDVVVLSDKVLCGDEKVDFSYFCKLVKSFGLEIEQIAVSNCTNEIKLNKNTIIFLHDDQIDQFVSENRVFYDTNSEIVENQAIICGNGFAIAVIPLESEKSLYSSVAQKIKDRFQVKDILTFRLFGVTATEVEQKISELEMKNKPKITGKGLLTDLYLEREGQTGFISQEEVLINENFSGNIYAQNFMEMSEVVGKIMQLTNLSVSIKDSFTGGKLANDLLKQDKSKRITTETFIANKELNFVKVDEQCYRDESEMVYQMSANLLEMKKGSISVVLAGSQDNAVYKIFLAIGKKQAIDIFKLNIEGNKEDAVLVAENFVMFNLIKKLREKDFEN